MYEAASGVGCRSGYHDKGVWGSPPGKYLKITHERCLYRLVFLYQTVFRGQVDLLVLVYTNMEGKARQKGRVHSRRQKHARKG